jgi:hypothetical protein
MSMPVSEVEPPPSHQHRRPRGTGFRPHTLPPHLSSPRGRSADRPIGPREHRRAGSAHGSGRRGARPVRTQCARQVRGCHAMGDGPIRRRSRCLGLRPSLSGDRHSSGGAQIGDSTPEVCNTSEWLSARSPATPSARYAVDTLGNGAYTESNMVPSGETHASPALSPYSHGSPDYS